MILMIFILLNCLSYSNTRNKRCMIQSSPPFHQLYDVTHGYLYLFCFIWKYCTNCQIHLAVRCYLPSDPCLLFQLSPCYQSWSFNWSNLSKLVYHLRWIWGHHCNCRELLPTYWKIFFGFHWSAMRSYCRSSSNVSFRKKYGSSDTSLITIVAAPGSLCLTGYLKTLLNLILSCRSIVRFISSIVFRCAVYASTFVQASFYPSCSLYIPACYLCNSYLLLFITSTV